MPIPYQEIRDSVMTYLRARPKGEVPMPPAVALDTCVHNGHTLTDGDIKVACEVFHELYLERIIAPGNVPTIHQISLSGFMGWPFYCVTEYGAKILNNPDYQPHDPDGYLQKLKLQVPAIDPDIIRYLEESLSCYKYSLLLASAVMLGCAAEGAMLLLIEGFGDAIQDAREKSSYEKETKSWQINKKYQAFRKWLEPLAPRLPEALRDDLQTVLDQIFDLIRRTRNSAGHPTGKSIERDTMHAHLMMFPSYCRRVYLLIEYFVANPVT